MISTKAAYFSAAQAQPFLPASVLAPNAANVLAHAHWKLLVLNPAGIRTLQAQRVRCTCDTLLLPSSPSGSVTQLVSARQIVEVGLSPRCSVTFSSLQSTGSMVCIQRTRRRADGSLREPQELLFPPLPLSAEEQLLLFALRLLL